MPGVIALRNGRSAAVEMGVVWRAHDEYLHRDVAIKELRLGESADPADSAAAVRRMLREARAAAKLRHPGIVTVHDVVIEDDLPWIVMELIEGRSLADILDNDGPLAARPGRAGRDPDPACARRRAPARRAAQGRQTRQHHARR
ncbi:protein kinase domain-containing protein [Kibdelosporangium philippinense]|uniref:protein kinase domain-containing protein n=1 Tax=Kibdelosporangium philippinense TaxID=211113 RepID=UPI003609E970